MIEGDAEVKDDSNDRNKEEGRGADDAVGLPVLEALGSLGFGLFLRGIVLLTLAEEGLETFDALLLVGDNLLLVVGLALELLVLMLETLKHKLLLQQLSLVLRLAKLAGFGTAAELGNVVAAARGVGHGRVSAGTTARVASRSA